MSQNHKTVGTGGEQATVAFLEAQGYRLVDANVRPLEGMARGEIDLIAWQDEYLVFVEVKTRRRAFSGQGAPAEAIDRRKRAQLTRLAEAYLARHGLDDVPCRFDVVLVFQSRRRPPRFVLVPDAFQAEAAG